MRNTVAVILAILAGLLLISAGITSEAVWHIIRDFAITFFGEHWALLLLFRVLIFIASLGGIAVILGAFLILLKRITLGKLLISLGTGTGLIGLLFTIIPIWVQKGSLVGLINTGTLGIILSIASRMIVKD